MARVAGTAAAEAALMKALLRRACRGVVALRAAADRRCQPAEDVVQDVVAGLAASGGHWRHRRSARAWLFTVARNMIIDDRRSARYRNVVASTDVDGAPEQATPDEVNSALDRLLIAGAMAQLSAEHRAVIRAVLLPRLDHRTDRCRPRDRRGNSEVATTLCRARVAAHSAGTWSNPMTAQPPIRVVIGSECLKGERRWMK